MVIRTFNLVLLAVCLALPGVTAAAERDREAHDWETLTIDSRIIALDKVTPRELYDGPRVLGIGSSRFRYRQLEGPAPATTLLRRLPDLWQLRLAERDRLSELQVSYEVVSASGREGFLSHDQDPDLTIPVRARPLPLSVWDDRSGRGTRIVQGGLALEIDVGLARRAGSYGGTLVVTISRF